MLELVSFIRRTLRVHFQDSSQKINLCSSLVLNKAASTAVPAKEIFIDFQTDFLKILSRRRPQFSI